MSAIGTGTLRHDLAGLSWRVRQAGTVRPDVAADPKCATLRSAALGCKVWRNKPVKQGRGRRPHRRLSFYLSSTCSWWQFLAAALRPLCWRKIDAGLAAVRDIG